MRRGASNNPFVTNTYSDYAPAYPGDTVEEQAFLMKQQRQAYDQATLNFQNSQNAISQIETAPGQSYWKDRAAADFDSEYEKAKQEGNFEDMVPRAGEIVKKVSDDYYLPQVIKDRARYEADLKAIEDSENPIDWKEFQKSQIQNRNKGVTVKPDGTVDFNPYQSHDELAWMDITKYLNDEISGWKANGIFEYDEATGTYNIKEDIVSGKAILKKNTGVTDAEIRKFALESIATNPELNRSIQDQAKVSVESLYLNKGEFTKEDFMALAEEDIPYEPGTAEYAQLYTEISTAFDKQLERQLTNGLKGSPQEKLLSVAKGLKNVTLKQTYAGMMADKHGFLNEQLQSWDLPDPEEDGAGAEVVNMDGGFFNDTTVASSDTIVRNNLDLKKKISNQRVDAEKELARLKRARENGDSVPQSVIDQQGALVQDLANQEANLATDVRMSADSVFRTLKDKGHLGNYANYDAYQEANYEKYLENAGSTTSTPSMVSGATNVKIGENYQELYKEKIDPNAQFGNEDAPLTKEQFFKLQDAELTGYFASEGWGGDYNGNFVTSYAPSLSLMGDTKASEYFNNFQVFDIITEGASQKQKAPYLEYNQAKIALNKTLSNSLGEMVTAEGGNLVEYNENLTDKQKAALDFDIITQPINGKLAFAVDLPGEDGKVNTQIVTIDPSSPNFRTATNAVSQALGGIVRNLLTIPENELTGNKRDMLVAANRTMDIIDGTKARFDRLPLWTAPEGTIHDFAIGNANYKFAPYQYGNEGQNRIMIMKEGITSWVGNNEGALYKGYADMGVLGYHKNQIGPDGQPVAGAQPQYYAYNYGSSTSAITMKNDGTVAPADWFVPADYKNPDEVLKDISLEEAKLRGTINKAAPSSETLVQDVDGWKDYSIDAEEVKTTTTAAIQQGYNKDNGYYPMTSLMKPEQISIRVAQPFLAVNTSSNEAVNRISSLFSDYPLIVTGGGRDEHNQVAGGAKNSKHKVYGAVDVLKTREAMALANLTDEQLIEYGIDPDSLITSYSDHIHFAFLPKYLKDVNPVN